MHRFPIPQRPALNAAASLAQQALATASTPIGPGGRSSPDPESTAGPAAAASSSKPIAGRDMSALARVSDALVRRQRKQLKSPKDEALWIETKLRPAQLALVSELNAVGNQDALPPQIANQTHAQHLTVCDWILDSARAEGQTSTQIEPLKRLLMLGQMVNRWVGHGGFPVDKLPALVYQPSLPNAVAGRHICAKSQMHNGKPYRSGSREIHISGQLSHVVGGTVMSHEMVHGHQLNRRHPEQHSQIKFELKEPIYPTEDHPRAGWHEAARGLPSFRMPKPHARSSPSEVQPSLEQAGIFRLTQDHRAGLAPSQMSPASAHGLARLLARVAEQSESSAVLPAADEAPTTDSAAPAAEHDIHRVRTAQQMDRVYGACVAIREAASSRAWGPSEDQRFAALIEQLSNSLPTDAFPRLDASHLLQTLADALIAFMDRLRHAQPWQLMMPAGSRPSVAALAQAKGDPVANLQEILVALGFDADLIPSGLRAAKCKRHQAEIAALKTQIEKGEEPSDEALRAPVLRLAAALIGVEVEAFEGDLLPSIHRVDGPEELPYHVGLNLAAKQTRKAEFHALGWQISLPTTVLQDGEKLEDKLDGMAARMAYTMAALMARRRSEMKEKAAAMQGADYMQLLTHIDGLVAKLKPRSDATIAQQPKGIAAALRHLARKTPQQINDLLFHDGTRAELKALARGDTTPDGPQAALDAQRHRRWQRPAVAWMRAVRIA